MYMIYSIRGDTTRHDIRHGSSTRLSSYGVHTCALCRGTGTGTDTGTHGRRMVSSSSLSPECPVCMCSVMRWSVIGFSIGLFAMLDSIAVAVL